jgi:glycosyltransferase involved in cell wall biosynthesis
VAGSTDESNAIELPSYRVMMVAPTSFFADYGCHVRILEEARILQKMGHRVTIVAYRNGHDLPGFDIRRTLPIPWRQKYEVGSSRHKLAFDALLGATTLSLLFRERFDLIHAHLHEGALIGLVLGKLRNLPVLFDFQGSLTEEMADHGFLKRTNPLFSRIRRLESWIDRSVPSILTSSNHARRLLIEQFNCSEEKVQTLPDCVNCEMFRPAATYPPEELRSLRRHLGIPDGRKILVYLGLLAEHQGISHLLSALQQVLQKRKDIHLLLMGFPNEVLYRQQGIELGIQEHVTLTGRVPYYDAPRHLALGDVAVAPKLSKTEGAGKLLNYMALGLPTVAYDIPVAREYLGLEGIFAQRGDINDLAEKLLQAFLLVSEQKEVAQYMGERLRKRAIALFDWETAGRQITETYDSLVDHRDVKPLVRRRWAVDRE